MSEGAAVVVAQDSISAKIGIRRRLTQDAEYEDSQEAENWSCDCVSSDGAEGPVVSCDTWTQRRQETRGILASNTISD